MTDGICKKFKHPNVATRRVRLYPSEDPSQEYPLEMLSGTMTGWLEDKDKRDVIIGELRDITAVRASGVIKSLVSTHKATIDDYLTAELNDFILEKKVWKYGDVLVKYNPSKIEHAVGHEWIIPDQRDTLILRIGDDVLSIFLIFEEGSCGVQYGFPELGWFQSWNMGQTMGEYRAFDFLSQYKATTYTGSMSRLGDELNEVIKTVRDEMVCRRDNITLPELKFRQNHALLDKCLDSFKRVYVDYASKVLPEFGRQDYHQTVETQLFKEVALFKIKLRWLSVTISVTNKGDLSYHMPVLNDGFDNIRDLTNTRFSHLSPTCNWDLNRDRQSRLDALEARIVELTTIVLTCEQEH